LHAVDSVHNEGTPTKSFVWTPLPSLARFVWEFKHLVIIEGAQPLNDCISGFLCSHVMGTEVILEGRIADA